MQYINAFILTLFLSGKGKSLSSNGCLIFSLIFELFPILSIDEYLIKRIIMGEQI